MAQAEQPFSANDFRRRAEGKRAVAKRLEDDKANCQEAWLAAGSAVEFMLKALIMKRGGLNGWPDRSIRPGLHTHDLRELMREAGIAQTDIPADMRSTWRTVLTWDHGHEYRNKAMPRRVARDMVKAVFGEKGVCKWLATL